MYIRPVTQADIPSIIDIMTMTMEDEEFFIWLCPQRQKYPISWRNIHERDTRRRMVTPDYHGIVCVEPTSDSAQPTQEEIVGYAFWQANTKPGLAWHRSNRSLLKKMEWLLWKAEGAYNDLFRLNAATEYSRAAALAAPRPDGQLLPQKVLSDYWHLGALCVAPQHQRKGVGAMLLQWGLDIARSEGTPIQLRATYNGEQLYRRYGFRTIARDPTWTALGLRGGNYMVFDPKQEWIRAAGDDERSKVVQGTVCQFEAVWTEKALGRSCDI